MRWICLGILLLGLCADADAQTVRVIPFTMLESWMNRNDDSTYVFNFWATWCGPCVEELPYFDSLQHRYRDTKLRVVLVSLDFKSQVDSKVIPFLRKNGIRASVVLLDETDANTYIDKVSPFWSGAIPATLIINRKLNLRRFHERSFEYPELESFILPLLERTSYE